MSVSIKQMNPLDTLFLVRDVINLIDSAGVTTVGADGHRSITPVTAAEVETLVPKVEALLTANGVVIPSKVDEFLPLLPLILSLVGLK